ncbi:MULTISPECIES: helix-turn-helix transcriptional regulator [Listeria]|uniref:helix-turn-helix transcriptional regulator n=1 Tax=Listeria TaxID=1637 RepID=UPI001628F365|nr:MULTISPECIES: helix-turn-helix transcriptional regulator [Listeria]EAG9591282.1 XRE family transcriptional regulator [Listeria monocytogenes]EJA7861943.1 helix-turn-helix transcriptional regulator [Listeria monocytogenes]MBC1516833.1 helix-turn-helix transcriptional regulator [Listeria immobilis]MBF2642853.1 helix-turn-helix transcriptional regulator [Listeria seeligeri]MBK2004153.1 helix-turn-helix transcriptional regulator [Listeria ivanovii subsp. londoniensis]
MTKLKKIRLEKGYTLEKVAISIGVSIPYYSMIENEKRRVSYELAVKIANFFNMKPDDIFLDSILTRS